MVFRGPYGVLELKAIPATWTLGMRLWVSGQGRQLTSKCVSVTLGCGAWEPHTQAHAPGSNGDGEEPVDLP